MKKSELTTRIQKRLQKRYLFLPAAITEKWIAQILKAAGEEINAEIKAGGSVKVLDLGMFKLVDRAARRGRNPKTGEPLTIPARRVVKYTPGAAAKRVANG